MGEQGEQQEGWLSLPHLVDRQGGFDIFAILDGALNYGIILRTIVLNIIAVRICQIARLKIVIGFRVEIQMNLTLTPSPDGNIRSLRTGGGG